MAPQNNNNDSEYEKIMRFEKIENQLYFFATLLFLYQGKR